MHDHAALRCCTAVARDMHSLLYVIACRRRLRLMHTLSEMRGRAAGRFLGEMTTPTRPVESLLHFLVGIFSQNFTYGSA